MNFNDYKKFYKVDSWEEIYNPDVTALRQKLDMVLLMDEQDPPLYLHNPKIDTVPVTAGGVIHHPRHIKFLKRKCDSLGIKSAIVIEETPVEERVDMVDFFLEEFFRPTSSNKIIDRKKSDILMYPNPMSSFVTVEIPNPLNENFRLTLTDLSGKIVQQMDNITDDLVQIERGNLEKGLYIIQLDGPVIYRDKIVIE